MYINPIIFRPKIRTQFSCLKSLSQTPGKFIFFNCLAVCVSKVFFPVSIDFYVFHSKALQKKKSILGGEISPSHCHIVKEQKEIDCGWVGKFPHPESDFLISISQLGSGLGWGNFLTHSQSNSFCSFTMWQ